jgi:purine-nucleoside phosphorylase
LGVSFKRFYRRKLFMSIHINAKAGEISDLVILPGDPLRAKYIAENMLSDIYCYNQVRGMLGYTGYFNNVRVSIQSTGMGIPSHMIYVDELIQQYGARKLIRVGTCGGLHDDVKLRDLILVASASTDSAVIRNTFPGATFAPTANMQLFLRAVEGAKTMNLPIKLGSVLTSDIFYNEQGQEEAYKIWRKYGALAVEMETAGLYFIAARYGVEALSMLTVSDHLATNEHATADERQNTFTDMTKLALNLLTAM